jgi:hypothetical protein
MKPFKATAVLLRWKRPKELKEIISHLKQFPHLIDEIIVWDNRKQNLCGYGRYLASLEAKNNVIYTQDDDTLIYNLDELFAQYNNQYIVNNMKEGHLKLYKNLNHTLPGWGLLFNKKWISCLNKYIQIYGLDDMFLRDTGRLFTGLFGKWKSIEGDIEDFSSASDPKIALWKQKEHKQNRTEIINRIDICNSAKIKPYNYIKIK